MACTKQTLENGHQCQCVWEWFFHLSKFLCTNPGLQCSVISVKRCKANVSQSEHLPKAQLTWIFHVWPGIETPTFHYSQIPQPHLNRRGYKASSCQAQTSWIRRQSKMNTKRWANHMFCPSPQGIIFLQWRTIWKLPKRKRRTKALRSIVSVSWNEFLQTTS